jgi:hypothetical protein
MSEAPRTAPVALPTNSPSSTPEKQGGLSPRSICGRDASSIALDLSALKEIFGFEFL